MLFCPNEVDLNSQGYAFPIFMASDMVSGSFLPVVSGKVIANIPAIMATDPMTVIGNGFHIYPSGAMHNAIMPPTLAMVLQLPTAVPRRGVG